MMDAFFPAPQTYSFLSCFSPAKPSPTMTPTASGVSFSSALSRITDFSGTPIALAYGVCPLRFLTLDKCQPPTELRVHSSPIGLGSYPPLAYLQRRPFLDCLSRPTLRDSSLFLLHPLFLTGRTFPKLLPVNQIFDSTAASACLPLKPN